MKSCCRLLSYLFLYAQKETHQTRHFLYLHILHESVSFCKPFYTLDNVVGISVEGNKAICFFWWWSFFSPPDGLCLLTSIIIFFLLKKPKKNNNSIYYLNFWRVLLLSTKPTQAWNRKQDKKGWREKQEWDVFGFFFSFFSSTNLITTIPAYMTLFLHCL